MSVEAATFISQLDQNLPGSGGIAGEGDDHIRLVKDTLLNTIPLTGLVTALFADLNLLTGAAANGLTVADMTKLADVTASAAELNVLDGILAGTAELNLLAGRSLASSDDVIDNFPAGTLMLFQQQTAPAGWTRQTTHNNKALRIVNGTTWAGSGGSVAFSTVFARTATDAGTAPLPSHSHGAGTLAAVSNGAHTHTVNVSSTGTQSNKIQKTTAGDFPSTETTSSNGAHTHSISGATASAGTGGTHAHNMDIRVQYVDTIIARKN